MTYEVALEAELESAEEDAAAATTVLAEEDLEQMN